MFFSTCNSLAFAIKAIFHNKRYQYRGGSLFEGPFGEKEWPSEAKALLLGSAGFIRTLIQVSSNNVGPNFGMKFGRIRVLMKM